MKLTPLIKQAYLDAGADPKWVQLHFDMSDKLYPTDEDVEIDDAHVPRLLAGMVAHIKSGRVLSEYLFTPEAQLFMQSLESLN